MHDRVSLASPALRVRRIVLVALAGAAFTGVPPAFAGTGAIAVNAVVLSKSNCKFSAGAIPDIDFGTIDPSTASTITKTTTKTLSCAGSAANATFDVTLGNGSSFSGGTRRMRHTVTTTELMAYGLSVSPASATVAKNATVTITITATLVPSDFADAIAGNYSDTVTVTLSP